MKQHTESRTFFILLAVMTLAALFLAGCGGGQTYGSGQYYYGAPPYGYYDGWYRNDVIVMPPPSRPPHDRPRPEHPIYKPPAQPMPLPATPLPRPAPAPRPMPRRR